MLMPKTNAECQNGLKELPISYVRSSHIRSWKIKGSLKNRGSKWAHGPDTWEKVRTEIKAVCVDLNEEMGGNVLSYEPKGSTHFTVKFIFGETVRWLRARFDSEKTSVHWTIEAINSSEDFHNLMTVNADGTLSFVNRTPDSMAKQMMQKLIPGG
jgi:hypothetical protein